MIILIVDDNTTNLKLLRAQLEAEGHTVVEAANGIEALTVLERESVDAIISDILMPNMDGHSDGYRLCLEIRASAKLRQLPFILYSATYTSPADRRVALDLGANDFIAKPASIKEIIQALHKAQTAASQPQQVPAPAAKPAPTPKSAPPESGARVLTHEYSDRLAHKLEETNTERIRLCSLRFERLAHKFEENNAELQLALAQLQQSNREIFQRIAGLERVREGARATSDERLNAPES